MTIIGYQKKDFNFEDGNKVSGFYLYLTEERSNVVGCASERIFVSDSKLNGYSPVIGDEVLISYNRFGKVQSIEVI